MTWELIISVVTGAGIAIVAMLWGFRLGRLKDGDRIMPVAMPTLTRPHTPAMEDPYHEPMYGRKQQSIPTVDERQ